MTSPITSNTTTSSLLPSSVQVTATPNLLSRICLFIKSKAEAFYTFILLSSFIQYCLLKIGYLDGSADQHTENVVSESRKVVYGAASLADKFQQIQTAPFEEKLDLSEQIKWIEEYLIKDTRVIINRFSHNRSVSDHLAPLKSYVKEKNIPCLFSHIKSLPLLLHNISISADDRAALNSLYDNVDVYSQMDKLIHDLQLQEKDYENLKGKQIRTCKQIDEATQTQEIACLSDFQNVLINICSLPLYDIQRQISQVEIEKTATRYKLSFIHLSRLIVSVEKPTPMPHKLYELIIELQSHLNLQQELSYKLAPEDRLQTAMSRIYKDIILHHGIHQNHLSVAFSSWHMKQKTNKENQEQHKLEYQHNFIKDIITHIRHSFDKHQQIFVLQTPNELQTDQIAQWFQDINLTLKKVCFD